MERARFARGQLRALTGLRFFAALHVVAYHFGQRRFPPVLRDIVASGYTAVSLFFVLSGFVLAHSYGSPSGTSIIDRRNFWAARVARIYPVHLFALLTMLPAYVPSAPHRIWYEPLAVILLVQSWFQGSALAWNTPSWSLSVEVFFYAVFPWLLPRIERLAERAFLGTLVLVFAVGLIVPVVAALCWPWPNGVGEGGAIPRPEIVDFVRAMPLWHLPSFVMGALCGARFLRSSSGNNPAGAPVRALPSRWWVAIGAGGLLLCLACAARISDPLLRVGALAPLNCALVYGLAGQQGLVARFLGTPTLVLLGEASYATYLLHVPLQHWLRVAWEGMGLRIGASFILVFAVALVAVSLIAFKTIESPARRVIRLWLGRPARVSDPLKAPSA